MTADLVRVIEKLKWYAYARNRAVDLEPRTITVTDDEAVALLAALHNVGITVEDES